MSICFNLHRKLADTNSRRHKASPPKPKHAMGRDLRHPLTWSKGRDKEGNAKVTIFSTASTIQRGSSVSGQGSRDGAPLANENKAREVKRGRSQPSQPAPFAAAAGVTVGLGPLKDIARALDTRTRQGRAPPTPSPRSRVRRQTTSAPWSHISKSNLSTR